MTKTLLKEKGMHPVLLSFLLGMGGALAFLLPFLVVDKGFFLYCGDFNSQQIPFYTYAHQFIREGGGAWSWATDLGSSFINSYSFYDLGSPFFWLTIPFPDHWVPYLMAPLLVLKFGCIAAAACLYLKRYAKSRNMAVVCSLAYAFCGFNIYNIFFNHMLEPVILFTLLMWAMDAFVYDGQRGVFAILVGLALLDNYFFFVGNVVFLVLYFCVMVGTGAYKIRLSAFGLLVFEAVLGVGLGMALALPSFFNLIDNPRTDNFANGMNLVLYWHQQQYPAILSSLFMPPDPPYLPNVFTEGAIKWTSMSAFLPVVGMAGCFAYLKTGRRKGVKLMLIICFVMALVPILNSSFYAFNSSYYARWYYMPLLIVCLATLHSLEDMYIDLDFGVKLVLGITLVWGVLGLLPTLVDDAWTLGVAKSAGKFWLTWGTAVLGIGIFAALVYFFRYSRRFAPLLLSAVMGFSVFYAVVHISLGKFPQWEKDSDYVEQQYGAMDIELPEDGQFYRIDAYECFDNLGIWMNQPSIHNFNSTITPSIMEFYPKLGLKRDVASRHEVEHYAIRGLLNVRYTLMPQDAAGSFASEEVGSQGWHYLRDEGAFAVYENENYLPLGFTYDSFIRMDTLENSYENDRAPLLLRAIGLDEDQRLTYQHLFANELTDVYDEVSYERYTQDVARRRATASSSSWTDTSGFGVTITLPKENLVFFSVPYDEGFTAMVNGVETEILKVSGGMMAVEAPAGENDILFTYQTIGFADGVRISLACLLVWLLYMAGMLWYRKRGRALLQARAAAKQQAQAATAPPPGSPYIGSASGAATPIELPPLDDTPNDTHQQGD